MNMFIQVTLVSLSNISNICGRFNDKSDYIIVEFESFMNVQ